MLGVLIHCHVALHSSPNDAEKQMHTANAAMAARPDSSGGTQPRPCGRWGVGHVLSPSQALCGLFLAPVTPTDQRQKMRLLAGCENACSRGRSPRPVVSDSVGLDRIGLDHKDQITRISDRFQVVLRKDTHRHWRAATELGEDHLRAPAIPGATNPDGVWRGVHPQSLGRHRGMSPRPGVALPGRSEPGLCCRLGAQPFCRRTPWSVSPWSLADALVLTCLERLPPGVHRGYLNELWEPLSPKAQDS